MQTILDAFHNLTNAEWIIAHGGFYIIMAIVFAETGLFLGFMLPGDFLIFVSGTIVSQAGFLHPFDTQLKNLIFWESMLILCAVVGNIVGYWFGKKSGNYLFERKDTWFLKRKHIMQAKDFYEKKGGTAIIMARFLPVIRTFAPIVAGVVKMDFKKFMMYNVVGAFLWIGILMTAGYALGQNPWVEKHLEYIVLGLALVTTVPVLYKMIFSKNKTVAPENTNS